jgi:SAM-dependent methyltransferase
MPDRFARLARLALTGATCAAAAVHAQFADEVPFITTPDHVTVAMLDMARVGPSDRVIDLGSGDGRIVITAARRFGARGLGVEIVPDLVAQSRENARRAGVADRAEFREQDLFATDLSGASVITMYLLPEVNLQLRPRLLALAPGTRIVSHDWDMGDWLPDRTLTVAVPGKTVGREKASRLHLWMVPARVEGLWCGAQGLALRIEQRHQEFRMQTDQGAERRTWTGRIHGAALEALGADGRRWRARLSEDKLQVATAAGAPAGAPLRRAGGERCDAAAAAGS